MIWTLIVLSVLNHAAFSGSRVVMALSGLEMQASPFAIGLMLSFYSLLPAFTSVAAGRTIDRIGMRKPMVFGTLTLALGLAVPFAGWELAALFLASVAIGVGFMAFHICSQNAAGEIGDESARMLNFSLLSLGLSVSGFVGPTLTGVLIDTIGHRATFGALAMMPLITLLGLRRLWPAIGAPRSARASDRAQAGESAGGALELMRDPELKRLYLAVAVIASAWDVHQFMVPLYGAQLGLSASSIGLVLGAFAAATFVIRIVLPSLARRVSEWPLILSAMGTATLIYAVYPFFPTLTMMIALSFVLGLGLGVSQPMILTLIHRNAPIDRIGEAAGLRLMLVNVSQTVLPTAFGALGSMFGLAPLFWGMALLSGTGAVYVGRAPRNDE